MLLGVGFAARATCWSTCPDAAMDAAVTIIAAVRELVGDHVAHSGTAPTRGVAGLWPALISALALLANSARDR